MKRDLDCSYQVPWEIRVYHEAQEFALRWGLKWCRCENNTVRSLRCPGYSIGLREDVAKRFNRWLIWSQRKVR